MPTWERWAGNRTHRRNNAAPVRGRQKRYETMPTHLSQRRASEGVAPTYKGAPVKVTLTMVHVNGVNCNFHTVQWVLKTESSKRERELTGDATQSARRALNSTERRSCQGSEGPPHPLSKPPTRQTIQHFLSGLLDLLCHSNLLPHRLEPRWQQYEC
eukprot:6133463-Amphidinium_carterae.1